MTDLAPHVSGFLREHLPRQRNASRHTIASYSDSLLLLVCYVADCLKVRPSAISIEELTTDLIFGFLDHLEANRRNSVSTRNVRLAAVKSLFRYLEYRLPSCLELARQVHAIPLKKHDQSVVRYLDREEIQALLEAPDPDTQAGLRDRAMLHLAYAAGLRASELVGVVLEDLGQPGLDTVRIMGKGRKERVLPLWKETTQVIRDWLQVRPEVADRHLFLNARGKAISRHGFAHRLTLHAKTAATTAPSIADKRVFPHILRHSCAVNTLEATGDIRKVSLWLGHAGIQSTEIYLRTDPVGKLGILSGNTPPAIAKGAFKDAPDRLLAVLQDARSP
ncbi:MAG: tyrosine-type recombinase/integrase, partial [Boseongicola sp. SB0664_bin_43]|nr:tyrosine-type recombinase/integrase [Boseongicola sp. SB0664_bin_43]